MAETAGQKAVQPGTIKLNAFLYVVARDRQGKLQYNHRSGPVERGLGEWEHSIFKGGLAGMGYSAEAEGVPEAGFSHSQNCLTVLPGVLSPGPSVTALTSIATKAIRFFFEEKDSAGQYYLYACGVGEVTKIRLDAVPDVISVETASFNSSDQFGQAVRARLVVESFQADSFQKDAFDTFSSAQWILPPDNGDRIIELSEVGAGATVDTWNVRTDVVDGASHFVIAAQNFWRWIANGRGKKISACDILNNPALDNSWGAKFPVGDQGADATALVALHRFIFAITEDNVFGATEDFNADAAGGAVSFAEMLPDVAFTEEDIDGAPVTGLGSKGWDAAVIIPSGFALYRHNISDYEQIGPDVFPHNNGDEPNLTDQIRFGRHRGVAAIGRWLYKIYENADGSGFYILAGRKRGSEDGGSEPMVLQPIVYQSTGQALVLHAQRNGSGAPRLWWGRLTGGIIEFQSIDLGLDGGPFKPGGSFGEQSGSGIWFGKEFDLDAPGTLKLLREVEVLLDSGDAQLAWQNNVHIDGAASATIGATFTAGPSVTRFPAAQTTGRRFRPTMDWAGSGTYTIAGNSTRIRDIIYRGVWLPNVADIVTTVIDVALTARRRGVSLKKVRDDLHALISENSYPFVDIHGATVVQVVVSEDAAEIGKEIAGLEGRELIQISLSVQELA